MLAGIQDGMTTGYKFICRKIFSSQQYNFYHLGKDKSTLYAIDYLKRDGSGGLERISVDGEFPEYRKMYFGSHMINNTNLLVDKDSSKQEFNIKYSNI